MSEYIPDPIELGESRAESARDEFEHPAGQWKCYQCDALFDLSEGAPLSGDPYAPPACPECVREFIISMRSR